MLVRKSRYKAKHMGVTLHVNDMTDSKKIRGNMDNVESIWNKITLGQYGKRNSVGKVLEIPRVSSGDVQSSL